jgi:hypothetical protein
LCQKRRVNFAPTLATKFYLHLAARPTFLPFLGALPTTEQSTLTSFEDFDSQANNHSMNTTIGTSEASFVPTFVGTGTNHDRFIGKWVTDLTINQTSIAANTWTYDFAAASTSNWDYPVDASTDTKTYVCIYVWRPSTSAVVGTIADKFTGTTYNFVPATEQTQVGTFAGAAVSGILPNDVLVFEAWWGLGATNTNNAGPFTFSYFFDGTTEPTAVTGTAVTNAASFISTPETIALVPDGGLVQDETIYRAIGSSAGLASLSHFRASMG